MGPGEKWQARGHVTERNECSSHGGGGFSLNTHTHWGRHFSTALHHFMQWIWNPKCGESTSIGGLDNVYLTWWLEHCAREQEMTTSYAQPTVLPYMEWCNPLLILNIRTKNPCPCLCWSHCFHSTLVECNLLSKILSLHLSLKPGIVGQELDIHKEYPLMLALLFLGSIFS